MKKTTIYGENSLPYTLYADVDAVYGGWMLTTEGEPITLNALEDEGDSGEQEIAEVNAILDDPSTAWEPLEAEDEEYIRDVLEAWGILK